MMKESDHEKISGTTAQAPGEFRRGGRHRRERGPGAKTFRRGRAIEFLARMEAHRATLKRQLETPELQSINPVLIGELKAIETVIDEFVQLFDIHQDEITESGTPFSPPAKADEEAPAE